MPPFRVLVVEDDPAARVGIATVISKLPGLELVGEVPDGEHVVPAVQAHHPDVVLMDIQLGAMDGIEALREVRRLPNPPHVLMLTAYNWHDYIVDAIDAGADGYVLKVQLMEDVMTAISAVMAGDAFLSPAATRRLLESVADADVSASARAAQQAVALLTDKEREVLVEVASGETNSVIGARIFLSEGTVKAHVASLCRKLGCNRTQAALIAERSGLLRPPPSAAAPPGATGPDTP